MSSHMNLSDARLSLPPSELALTLDLVPEIQSEVPQFASFCWVNTAHVIMLEEQDIITTEKAKELVLALETVRKGGVDGLKIDPKKGTLQLQIESRLTELVGEEIAGCLSTALSRIDQGTTVCRVHARGGLLAVTAAIVDLQKSLLAAAKKFRAVKMMTWTHMQQAQPGNLAHYFDSFIGRLTANFEQLQSAYGRLNLSPLGAAGLAGTSWDINRDRTAELLGCDGLVYNSRLGRDTAYAAEIASLLSLLMSTLNFLASDLHIWCSNEFGLIRLGDDYAGTSSIFPQKVNPITLERVKLEAGVAAMWGASAVATFRGAGTGDQVLESVPVGQHLAKAVDMLRLMAGIVASVKPDERRIDELHAQSWSTTNALTDFLVDKENLSSRQAHHVVGRFVKLCVDGDLSPADVTPGILTTASQQTLGKKIVMAVEQLKAVLGPDAFIETRTSTGGVAPEQVTALLLASADHIAGNAKWVEEKQAGLKDAKEILGTAIAHLCAQ